VDKVAKVADGRKLEKAVADAGGELEMLIEIVNSLKIDDATETTRIIDSITAVYSTLNQVKAALKKHLQALVASESAAQFNAQLKLLGQSASSYLDLCDTPEKCDEYLSWRRWRAPSPASTNTPSSFPTAAPSSTKPSSSERSRSSSSATNVPARS
jgi:hypothetical protein